MAYSELIKNFDRIRDYMRQFYVYGFKSRTEYDAKSGRSYDNERRRVESWLGDSMRFRLTPEGKHVFLSMDSRAIRSNPLYNAFKAKSFTAGDVTFHFYILDLLQNGDACTARQITDLFAEKYLSAFETDRQPDISTIRKKLKEYVALGLLQCRKQGRELLYSRSEDALALNAWADALAFFSEADPLGVIGSTLLDKLEPLSPCFRFKHHYMLHALDSQILLELLTAIGEHKTVELQYISPKTGRETAHTVCPLKIYISTQGGRQYLLCFHYRFKKLMFFRLDFLHRVTCGHRPLLRFRTLFFRSQSPAPAGSRALASMSKKAKGQNIIPNPTSPSYSSSVSGLSSGTSKVILEDSSITGLGISSRCAAGTSVQNFFP